MGLPVLLLTAVIGFAPYATNLLGGRHIFYALVPSVEGIDSPVNAVLEGEAEEVYPSLHNRLTRLLFSLFSYSVIHRVDPAELKNPFGAPLLEWQQYGSTANAKAGGLGPLFPLLLIVSVLYQILLRGRGNGWLIFTLSFMTLIQPHSWQVRFVPFVWALPFIILLSLPKQKNYLLGIPLFIAAVNTLGVACVAVAQRMEFQTMIEERLEPHRGRHVLVDRTVFQYDGIFDRFGIRQKFIGPQTPLSPPHLLWVIENRERNTGRNPLGNNILFENEIPVLSPGIIYLDSDEDRSWMQASQGLILHDPEVGSIESYWMNNFVMEKGCWNYAPEVEFYMRVPKKIRGDTLFTLSAIPSRNVSGGSAAQIVQVLVNGKEQGTLRFDSVEPGRHAVLISREVLEESYEDEMNLLLLTLRIAYAEDSGRAGQKPAFSLMFESMEFRDND